MKHARHILAIDNGTQSLRALIFDENGNMVAKSRVAFNPYVSAHNGWAEQDPELYWEALCEACHELWRQKGVDRTQLAGVVVTTQRGTVINLDKDGNPLRPAILWLDKRTVPNQKPVGGLWGLLFKIAGVSDTVAHLQANAESIWIRTHQPQLWAKTHKFVLLSGYLNFKLTGKHVDSIGSQVGYLPFDYKSLSWAKPGDWRWNLLGIAPEQLDELVQPGQILGTISPRAARETGIPELPVLAGAADKACEVLGAGALTPEIGCISYGTTATISTTNSRYVEPTPFIPPYPAGVPGAYSPEIQIFRGFWMVEWFKQQFGHRESQLGLEQGVTPELLLEELIHDIPAGCDGLVLQPFWTPGIKIPGPEARGGIIGFQEGHTRGHVYRAILEGLAFALREGKERLDRRSGTPITSLRVAGGGSQSDTAMQITADIFALPAVRPHVYETSGLGAALIGAVGLGLHPDFATAVKQMTRQGRVFEPIPDQQQLYQQIYSEVYQKMYPRLKPLYHALSRIFSSLPGSVIGK